jgi:SPP1 gp7 family putative phage head morphogenesis protein
MALEIRRFVTRLGQLVLGMALAPFARQDATDDDEPKLPVIPGAAAAARLAASRIRGASIGIADKVQRHNKSEFKRLGIDVRKEPSLARQINRWRDENVDRVGSLLEFERDELAGILERGWGKTIPELRATIEERLQVSTAKADLLARDQVLTLNGQITQERQQAAGIISYVWSTSNDERVRPMHEDLDGETFDWDDPPVTNEAGDTNHPGGDYQCRCVAAAILPELD